jgi:hypothetical protein
MRRNKPTLLLALPLLLLAACGGSGTKVTPLAAQTPPKAEDAGKDTTAAKPGVKKVAAAVPSGHRFDTAAAGGLRPIVRETYQYASEGSRDPFKPYVEQVERGPELPDLRLVALLYDDRDPSGSIATFRDIGNDHRYTVSPGQRIGRITVATVTSNTVKLRIDDFGTAREQTYMMRKPEDSKP